MKKIILILMFVMIVLSSQNFARIFVTSRLVKEIEKMVQDARINKPYQYKNLTIFPVSSPSASRISNLIALDEALKEGYLKIGEISEQGNVPEIEVENKSKFYIFLMSGEIVTGGKQDRMISDDVIIPPKSGKMKVKVYCTERGRWEVGESKGFGSKKSVSNLAVRQAAKETKSQGVVWENVEKTNEKLGCGSPTGTLQAVYDNKEVQKKSEKYYNEFIKLPKMKANTNGVIVAVGDEILGVDIFYDRNLFQKLWDKLLRSYIIEALEEEEEEKLSVEDAKKFLNRVYKAECIKEATSGVGDLYSIKSKKVSGGALVYKNQVIHFDLFPNKK